MRQVSSVVAICCGLTGCGSLYPPEAESEITLQAALVGTVDSLAAMKRRLNENDQQLGVYAKTITAEFYVKGQRVQNSGISADVGLAPAGPISSLVLKPSYSRADTGERSNKITIVFESLTAIQDKQVRSDLLACMSNPTCAASLKGTGGILYGGVVLDRRTMESIKQQSAATSATPSAPK